MGRRQARAGRRHPPRRHPADGSHANFYGEALYLGSSGRGRRLRRHARADVRRPAGRADDPERSGRGRTRVSLDRVRGPMGRAPAGVLQRPDRAEPEDAVDRADRAGREDWRDAELRRAGRRRVRTGGDRLLLRRRRDGLAGARAARAPIRSSRPRARRARAAARRPALAHDLAAVGSAALGAPASVGPDPRRLRCGCTASDLALRRHRRSCCCRSRLLVTLLQALLPSRNEHPRRPDGGREQRVARLLRRRDRDGADAARPRLRDGGDGARARRDRRGRPIGVMRAYRLASRHPRRCSARCSSPRCVVSLLASSIFLSRSPSGSRSAGPHRPAIELEDVSSLRALRRSGRLVRGLAQGRVADRGRRCACLVAGPLLGALLILVDRAPFWLVNVWRARLRGGDAVRRPHVRLRLLRCESSRRDQRRTRRAPRGDRVLDLIALLQ